MAMHCFDEGATCEAQLAQRRLIWEARAWALCFDADATRF